MTDYSNIIPETDVNNSGPLIKKRYIRLFIFFIGMSVVFTVTRCAVIFTFVEPNTGLYAVTSGILPHILDYIVYAFVIVCVICSRVVYKKAYAFENVQGTPSCLFTSVLCGFMLLAMFVLQLLGYFDMFSHNGYSIIVTAKDIFKNNLLEFILVILSFPCAMYFFKSISRSSTGRLSEQIIPAAIARKKETIYSIFSFTPIIWLVLRLAICFFDTAQLVNTSGHKLELLMLVALVLFFLADARMIIGDTAASPLFFFGFAAIFMVGVSAVPNLILSSIWLLKTRTTLIIYTVEIAFMAYAAAKLYSQLRHASYSDYEDENIKEARIALKKNL